MILEHFGLKEQPFGATPDPRFLFESETHREALASLLYGVETARGFVALIAKPGMGKTTLLFRSLSELGEKVKTVFLFQPASTPLDFLRALLADLGVQELQGGVFELQAKLNEILRKQSRNGERLVLVVDEAQNLDESVLEFVRMLSNFESPKKKLIQIILSGQPEFARKLASSSLVQLRQRISIISHLKPLSAAETANYVNHRLRLAGYGSKKPLFTSAALQLIAENSEGIPRNINNLCFNALSLGYALKRQMIDIDIVREVISDLDLSTLGNTTDASLETRSGPAPVLAPAAKFRFGPWLLKTAAVVIALLALSGLLINRELKATVLADVIEYPSKVKEVPSRSLSAEAKRAPEPAVAVSNLVEKPFEEDSKLKPKRASWILVTPGVTLSEICYEKLDTCNSRKISEILRLNPWLTNPDHLESGQKVRIPSRSELMADAQSSAGPTSSKLQAEAATP